MTDDQPKRRQPGKRGGGQGATRRNAPSSPEALFRLERDQRGLELRRAGMTFDAIARASREQSDWPASYSDAGHAYREIMKLVRSLPKEDADEYRRLLTDRCELVVRTMMSAMLREPDTGKKARAATSVLRAVRQLQLLHVPELPQQVEVTVLSEFETALRDLHDELAARADGRPVPVEP